MKKVTALFALLLVIASAGVFAAPDSWGLVIMADDGSGDNGSAVGFGVLPDALDGVDEYDTPITPDVYDPATILVSAVIDGGLYLADYMSPALPETYPGGRKTWDFRVAALSSAAPAGIRLQFLTESGSGSFPPTGYAYKWTMVDNRGMGGAPANGSEFALTIPDTTSTIFDTVYLPMIKLQANTTGELLSHGYHIQFTQEAIPEPSSLLALGSGLLILSGLRIRKR